MKILRFATVAFTLFGASVNTAYADTIELYYNQWFPSGHWSQSEGLYPWFEEIATVTEGRVKVIPSVRPVVGPRQNYDAVVNGIVDVAWGPHGYTPDKFPLTEMIEQPFTSHNAGISSAAYWDVWEKHFKPTGMQEDVITLGMHTTSGGNIHMRSKRVTSVDELLSKRLRVPTAAVGRVLEDNGGLATLAPIQQLSSMLNRGEVDGTAISDELAIGFNINNQIEAVTHIPGGLYANSSFIVVNKEKWAMISPEDQAAIRAISGKSISQKMGGLWQAQDYKANAILQEQYGDNYKTASPAFISDLEWIFLGEQENWILRANQLGVDAEAAIEMYRELRE